MLPQKEYVTSRGSHYTLDAAKQNVGGRHISRKFKFAELQTTDKTPHASQRHEFAELGEVKVKLYRCSRSKSKVRSTSSGSSFSAITGDGKGPEKALKGQSISNYAELGNAVSYAPTNRCYAEYKYGHEPLATWIFKYRSHKNSQVEGIIPPDIPLEERKPEDLTAEEARELIRRMRAQGQTSEIKCDPAMQDMKPVKQQHFIILDDDDDKGGEGSSSASASRGNSMKTEIEIVDLTDD